MQSLRTARTMGTCLSSCLPHSEASKTLRNFNILDNDTTGVDFTFLVDDNVSTNETKGKRIFDNENHSKVMLYLYFMPLGCRSIFSRIFRKRKNKKKPVLQLVDSLLNSQVNSYSRLSESQRFSSTGSCTSRDIQLQYLDARALLQRTTTSTPASSLDLEWEHETLPISMVHDPSGSSWTALPEDFSCCQSTSSQQNTTPAPNSEDWSRVSSTNSLEWDNVQSIHNSPPLSEVDTDTQFLLCEIERLTNKTLEETGRDLFS